MEQGAQHWEHIWLELVLAEAHGKSSDGAEGFYAYAEVVLIEAWSALGDQFGLGQFYSEELTQLSHTLQHQYEDLCVPISSEIVDKRLHCLE